MNKPTSNVDGRVQVVVIGKEKVDSQNPVHSLAMEEARRVGRLLAARGAVVLTGGLGGIMEAVSRGVADAGGTSVGITPVIADEERSWRCPNSYQTVCINTGLGQRERIPMLVLSGDAVIAISGGGGALVEAELAIRSGIPVITLPATGGTATKLAEDQEYESSVLLADNAEAAVSLALHAIAQRRQSK